jgi:tetratricopeptide (TPR) repeat protein
MRPGWTRVYVALGQLDELEGLNDAALANYAEAIDRGERQDFVVRRAVNLYQTKRQDDKAVGLLQKLSAEMRLPDDLERYRAIHRLLADEMPQNARPTIDRIAPAESTDYRILLLRGALLGSIRDDAAALAAFRRAVEVPGGEKVPGEGPIPDGQNVPETWMSLVGQLVKTGDLKAAKAAAAEGRKTLTPLKERRSPEARAELDDALGGLFELAGEPGTALAYYRSARETAPAELNPFRQLVLYYQRTGQPESVQTALDLLRGATDSPGGPGGTSR